MNSRHDSPRIAELEADNARLRRLLAHRDAPAELRHRLNSTLAMLRAIIRRSAQNRQSLSEYVAHLEDRMDALARAQSAADEFGYVDLLQLVDDELHFYKAARSERVTASGPPIRLQPRAGQIMGLAIHELVVNALEHGELESRTIVVEWHVDRTAEEPRLTLIWTERDGVAGDAGPPGFGTEVLTAMLRYELKAETELSLGPSGLRCRITFPMPERIGRVGHE